MAKHHSGENLRSQIARDAARLIAEAGYTDFHAAKLKAAAKLGVKGDKQLPSNLEVEDELRLYQQLYQASSHSKLIYQMRKEALAAMQYFQVFDPLLAGSVLHGTSTEHMAIELHLRVNSVKDVATFLLDRKIPFDQFERTYKIGKHDSINVPVFEFMADKFRLELIVFEERVARSHPLDPVTGSSGHRANISKVRELLALGVD